MSSSGHGIFDFDAAEFNDGTPGTPGGGAGTAGTAGGGMPTGAGTDDEAGDRGGGGQHDRLLFFDKEGAKEYHGWNKWCEAHMMDLEMRKNPPPKESYGVIILA